MEETKRLTFPPAYQDHYMRIRMLQNALFVAINGGPACDPLVRELREVEAAILKDTTYVELYRPLRWAQVRQELINTILEELDAVIHDCYHEYGNSKMQVVTDTGAWVLADLMELNDA